MAKVAHCLIAYLPLNMSYIHDQLLAFGPESSVVFSGRTLQPERFPFDPVYALTPPVELSSMSADNQATFPPFDVLWRPIVRAEEVGLLHVHDGRIAPMFLPVARHHRIPIVTTFFGRDVTAELDNSHYVNALRLVFSRGDLFTVMSRDMARQIRRLGCPEHKIRVIHHGVRLSRFPFFPRRIPEHPPVVILTAGRLVEKKGPDDLAQAFALLCGTHPDVILKIIGDGPLRSKMESIFLGAGVADRVEFLGFLELAAVAEQMRQAHIFCLPSRVGSDGDSEGIPNVLKEGMASGMPVVSTYHAGIPELVEDGISGYLVPERDVTALADRLRRLIDEPERWEAMGRAGRAKVEAEFSLDAVIRQLDDEVYTPLLGRASPLVSDGPPPVPPAVPAGREPRRVSHRQ